MRDKKQADEPTEAVVNPMPKEGTVINDLSEGVKIKTTDKAPHHKAGQVIKVSKALADKMIANKWATAVED